MNLRNLWPLAWAGTVRALERRLLDAREETRRQESIAAQERQNALDEKARCAVAIDHYRQVAKQWRWVMEVERAEAEGRPVPKLSEIERPTEPPNDVRLLDAIREMHLPNSM